MDELWDRIEEEHVLIERYYFDADPRVLFPPSVSERPLSLQELLAKHPGHRLLLFTDGASFFDPISGELSAAAGSFLRWPGAGLFTPKPVESWTYRETILADRIWILPSGLDALLNYARWINGVRHGAESHSISGAFPPELAERPERWLERDSPDPALIRQVLQSVRWYLGEEGYFWLSACAVYPEIPFNLTMYLGTNLKTEAGAMLFTTERLRALSRLPWMRQAYMPDWLRMQLVTGLSGEQNSQIREVLNRLWLSAAAGSTSAITLDIARRPCIRFRDARPQLGTSGRASPKDVARSIEVTEGKRSLPCHSIVFPKMGDQFRNIHIDHSSFAATACEYGID